MASPLPDVPPLRERLWRIIFLSDTPAGRRFDIVLLWLIALSVLTVILESVDDLRQLHLPLFVRLEWFFTIVFTVEYLTRLWTVRHRLRYVTSFFGLVDLVALLPSYIELFVPGTHYLMTLRVLRLMRIFRVLKMVEYLSEASILLNALRAGRRKILIFLVCVLALVLVEGTVMYVIERDANPDFSNIPQAVYWAVVTLTTVGYGDVAPVTVLGKMMASLVMLTGFAIIAVPTGIMTYEIGQEIRHGRLRGRRCEECGCDQHDARARYCHQCGTALK